jgi:bifunctional non-homologous end joining protein LigD
MPLPYTERRAELEALDLNGDNWRTPSHHVGDGEAMFAASKEQGLEGVVAKRLDSRYEPGGRSGAWLKIKNQFSQELVIGGWLPGQGGRSGTLGSLAVGFYEDGKLRYAGNVGTGFTQRTLAELMDLLKPLERPDSPFEGRQPPKGMVFVEPELVAEVEFRGWTKTRTLRQPSFKGLRDDKNARDVIFEEKVGVN